MKQKCLNKKEEIFTPIKRYRYQFLQLNGQIKQMCNQQQINQPINASPLKMRRTRLQSNNLENRRNKINQFSDNTRQVTEPNSDILNKRVFSLRKDSQFSQNVNFKRYIPNRKLSEDQFRSNQHPKSPPVLPCLNQSTFEITFQNPFFAKQSQSERRPAEFQALVYKRKSNN